jgi:hypothetical protein
MIWTYSVKQDAPINITKGIVQLNASNTTVLAELREAAYASNTLVVTFPVSDDDTAENTWGTHPEYKYHIRDLVVEVVETWSCDQGDMMTFQHERSISQRRLRSEWAELSGLPRLENLTINMQKTSTTQFAWPIFAPILIQIRKSKPNLHITFNISFDAILARSWNEEIWADPSGDAYHPMGFVDVTELVAPPTEEDRMYVREHGLSSKNMYTRDVVQGLLSETTANRRMLAVHYVVKEPQLLRVLMEEHYEIYETVKRENEDTH